MNKHKIKAAELRLQKDLKELADCSAATISFPDPENILHFILRIHPNDGIWANHNFDFKFELSDDWPIQRPKISILTRIWHPNIDEEGNICLDAIKEKYSPTLTIGMIAEILLFLFMAPNPMSPLNEEAANQYLTSIEDFKETANEYMEEYCPTD